MRDIIVLTSGVLILALGVFLVAGAAVASRPGALWADTADGGRFARPERGDASAKVPVGRSGPAYSGVGVAVAEMLATGPSARAVAPDGSFWISDPERRRLLQYDHAGAQTASIALPDTVIGVRDMALDPDGGGVYVLDVASVHPQLVHLDQAGGVLEAVDIPLSDSGTPASGLFAAETGALHVEQEGAVAYEVVHRRDATDTLA